MPHISVRCEYKTDQGTLWDAATSWDMLASVSKPLVHFGKLPTGAMFEGQKVETHISLLGLTKSQPYKIEIVRLDPWNRVICTKETGHWIRSWEHVVTVAPGATGSQMKDHVDIEAGLLNWPAAFWAKLTYRSRHRQRCVQLQTICNLI